MSKPGEQVMPCRQSPESEAPLREPPSPARGSHKPGSWVAPLICFIVAFTLSLLLDLFGSQSKTMLYFDSGHYLGSARQVLLFAQGKAPASKELLDCLMLDGPVLPSITAAVFTLLHKVPTESNWRICAFILSLLHALSAMLVCLLSRRLTGSSKWGAITGVCWAIYPGALASSGRFLLEPLGSVLLLASTLSLVRALAASEGEEAKMSLPGKTIAASVAAGVLQALLLLTRSVLLPVCLVLDVWVLALAQGKLRRAAIALSMAAGAAVALGPWLAFTWQICGHGQLLPERAPAINIAIGFNWETDGWDGKPDPPFQALYADSDSPLCTAFSLWKQEPGKLLNLFCRKVSRLFALPWNDFRYSILGIPYEIQRYLHFFLCLAAMLGAVAFASLLPPHPGKSNAGRFVAIAAIATIAWHLIYVLFQANPRYGFTAMPFAVILATYFAYAAAKSQLKGKQLLSLGIPVFLTIASWQADILPSMVQVCGSVVTAIWLDCLVRLMLLGWTLAAAWMSLTARLPSPSGKLAAALASAVLAFAGGVIFCAEALDSVSLRQWSCPLSPGKSACRLIHLKNVLPESARKSIDWALVLVDGDASAENAVLSVNGHKLSGRLACLYRYYPEKYMIVGLMQLFTPILGNSLADMRQWRAVPVPLSWINPDGDNLLSIGTGTSGSATIYGDYLPSRGLRRRLPALGTYSLTRSFNCPDNEGGFDGRPIDPSGLTPTGSTSYLTDGATQRCDDLSEHFGRQTGEYRLHLILGIKTKATTSGNISTTCDPQSKPASGQCLFTKQFQSGDFGPPLHQISKGQLHISKAITRPAPLTVAIVDVPGSVTAGSHLSIKLSGQATSLGRSAAEVGIVIMAEDRSVSERLQLAATPVSLTASDSKWKSFAISDCLPCNSIKAGPQRLRIEIYTLKGDTVFKDLSLELSPANLPTFTLHRAAIY